MAILEIKTDGTVEGTTITDETGKEHGSAVSVSVKGGPMEQVVIVINTVSAASGTGTFMDSAFSTAYDEAAYAGASTGDAEPAPITPAPKRKAREEKEG